jgi:hypothetical protein
LTAQPEVAQILASRTYQLPKPLPGVDQQAVDWSHGISSMSAPEVWSLLGCGEDIVVANIDPGCNSITRRSSGNTVATWGRHYDHNYNWFDPSEVCDQPSLVPCDNTGHGTHTMGTMVGDDGAPGQNQIGVAPMARWIAAKGCEDFFCSDTALLDSGQWILAPTDLNGANPRPDLRPHIVNNSWGGGIHDPWYQATVQAWIAAGIFPAFSNGNDGPFCESASSPGDYPEKHSAGAYDINGVIAEFSARGPSLFGGEIKPNLSAPGVDVRSSVPGNSYESFSGTSMASPHVAGTVALMWSAAPILVGDITQTRALLDQSAVDQSDLGCGGSEGDNNVFGEGRMDAFQSVENSPIGPTGELQGNVTDATTDTPLENIKIEVTGPYTRLPSRMQTAITS